MTHIKLAVRTVGLAAAVAWAVGAAKAQPVSDYTIANGGLEAFNLQIDSTTYNGANAVLAGGITFDKTSGGGPASFTGVCTDISGTVYLGYNYGYTGPSAFQGHTGLDPTWGANSSDPATKAANEAAAIQAAADILYKYGYVMTSGSTDQKAGLQLAVWAALYNTVGGVTPSTTLGGTGARFNILSASSDTWSGSWVGGSTLAGTAAAISDAQTYLLGVNFNDQYSGNLLIPSPTSQHGLTAQEMLLQVTPVPEPTTMIAGALLLLPFVASTLRSRSRRINVAKRIP